MVLISMATSSGDDLPRNVEFLYSRNRLNVAISRARCLAVIYANSRLLEIACNTVGQMELVNSFCWAKRFADAQRASLFPAWGVVQGRLACGPVDRRPIKVEYAPEMRTPESHSAAAARDPVLRPSSEPWRAAALA